MQSSHAATNPFNEDRHGRFSSNALADLSLAVVSRMGGRLLNSQGHFLESIQFLILEVDQGSTPQ
jgi:hypothetical protein